MEMLEVTDNLNISESYGKNVSWQNRVVTGWEKKRKKKNQETVVLA